jgi:hypothetical protein
MSLTLHSNNPCPKCGRLKMQSIIEAHPSRRDIAFQNFHCGDCGPVKTEVLSLTPPARPADVAA